MGKVIVPCEFSKAAGKTQAFQRCRGHGQGLAHRLHANAVTELLPTADLLIVKDVLRHWSNADILAFLPQSRSWKLLNRWSRL
jgi:hypothetical protein